MLKINYSTVDNLQPSGKPSTPPLQVDGCLAFPQGTGTEFPNRSTKCILYKSLLMKSRGFNMI